MSYKLAWMAGVLAVAAAALACGLASPASNLAERATSLAQTAGAVLTGTAQALPTTMTATPEPSASAEPSATPALTAPPTAATAAPGPTATEPPRPSATVTQACAQDDSEFVTDVSVPDGTHFAPGTVFVKTWRVRNSGPCTWKSGYTFGYVEGQVMGQSSITLRNEVPPGATVDISIRFTAPGSAGQYTSRYQMFNPAGEAFGARPYVEIVVP